MTLRALARGSLLYTAANLVPRLGAFLLLPLLTRFLGRADFGTLSLAGSAALLLSITLRLGLDAALLRLHFDTEASGRRDLYATVAALSAAGAMVLVLGAALVVPVTLGPATAVVALLAVATGALSAFQYLPSVWLRATEQPMRFLLLSLGDFAVTAAGTIALVVVAGGGVVGALIAQLLGAGVLAGAAAALLVRLRPWRPRRDLAARSLGFGLPLLPHAIGGWLLNVSDRWMLGLFLSLAAGEALTAIGVYSLGYQLGYAVALVAFSFNAAWLPLFYRLGEGEHGPRLLRAMTTVATAAVTLLATAVAVLAPELVVVMAGPEWTEAADVTLIVAFASVLNAVGLILAGTLQLVRRTRAIPLLTLAAAAVNLGANALLIPRLGIIGAAWSTLAAYAALAVLGWVTARRHYPVSLDWIRLTQILAAGLGLTVVARFIGPDAGSWAAAGWHALLAVVGAGLIAVIAHPAVSELRAILGRPEAAPVVG